MAAIEPKTLVAELYGAKVGLHCEDAKLLPVMEEFIKTKFQLQTQHLLKGEKVNVCMIFFKDHLHITTIGEAKELLTSERKIALEQNARSRNIFIVALVDGLVPHKNFPERPIKMEQWDQQNLIDTAQLLIYTDITGIHVRDPGSDYNKAVGQQLFFSANPPVEYIG